ncbi:ABC transporter ATP-binding protein [Lactobacillus gigeriorum]|uniref:Sulfate/thiosulfate ABC superfamily ATP binding cassette transporter, ABC protein n=1 Tax=Lactobacillus gigeriorum DSM 23908 = CRBIP 24.85 TaxID=1423751 RepID=I7LCB1_9LACO|nr:ATP-binding cassette domain-containing protein [Lactobacillus gigeriorum]CCI86336.1 Sulfate/thiosulfate ABC superfamily ATP binding cassette transporter, ABC protein [Lactobacillus gigeriorum DSM 23908 = CRBIP 24.85]
MDIIELNKVSYQVEDKQILKEIDLHVAEGQRITLTGPSGSGKSTILKLVSSLISPTQGQINFQGKDVAQLDPISYRRQVSYCFQQPSLFGTTVADNLRFPFELRDEPFNQQQAVELLWQVDLDESYLNKKIETLSGGEKQRVALIRNLLFPPKVLLLDEVTTGLDENSKAIVHKLIRNYHQEGTTILEVTHDATELDLANYLITIKEGKRVK